MRTNLKSRLGRASAAIAVGIVALMGVASTASAQYCSTWAPCSNYPYNSPYSNRGWTWGERYGAPPPNTYYSGQGYYAQQQRSYPQRYNYNNNYNSNPQALGPLNGLFAR